MTQEPLDERSPPDRDRDKHLTNGLDIVEADAGSNDQTTLPVGIPSIITVNKAKSEYEEGPVSSTGEKPGQEPTAPPCEEYIGNKRIPRSGSEDREQISVSSLSVTNGAPSLPALDLGFGTFEQSPKLEEENESLRHRMRALQEETEMLREECRVLNEEQEIWEKQLDDADGRINDLLIENRSLKSLPHPKSNEQLETDFRNLSINIGSWCDEASFKAETCLFDSLQVTEVWDMLSLDSPVERQTMEANRKPFGQAIIWTVLVRHVFQNNPQDTRKCKDLWTSYDEAQHLMALETRMMESDLSFGDLARWRCLTVGGLSQNSEVNRPRIKSLTANVFAFLSGLFGITNESHVNALHDNLEKNIMMKAVDLSKDLRMHPSRVFIRLPVGEEGTEMTTELLDERSSKCRSFTCKKKSKDIKQPTPLHLTIRPAMVRETDDEQCRIHETVVADYVTANIVSKIIPRRSNTE